MSLALKNYKSQFFRSDLTHMNNAGLAPITKDAAEEIKYWAKRFHEEGFYTDADYMKRVHESRESLSRLIGCESGEVAFFQSTAGAISQFAFMIGLKPGDEVVMWDQEYSSHLYPWQEACKRSGAKLVLVTSEKDLSLRTEKLFSHITEKTKVVAISWVQFQTGARSELNIIADFCRPKGIVIFADIMQGLGLHPFDFKSLGLDAVAGGSHKWLTAPVGVGFLAIRKELAKKMQPLLVGAYTYGTCEDPSDLSCEPKQDALRFESGSKQVLEITALGRSVDLILKTGVKTIEIESLRLANSLREKLESFGFTLHTPQQNEPTAMVNFSHPKLDRDTMAEALILNQINFARRGPGLRLSPHAFNNDKDIEKVGRILALLLD